MAKCCKCGKKIRKGEDFVLIGKYPSIFKKYFNWDFYAGLAYFGNLYCKDCFDMHK